MVSGSLQSLVAFCGGDGLEVGSIKSCCSSWPSSAAGVACRLYGVGESVGRKVSTLGSIGHMKILDICVKNFIL